MGFYTGTDTGIEVIKAEFDQPLEAGTLIGLRRHLMSDNPDAYYGWQHRYGETIGRLAADATSIDEVDLDIFVTTIDSEPASYTEQLHSGGGRGWQRVVGGRDAAASFDIKNPVNYTDIAPKEIGTGDPDYEMSGPSDCVPTIRITINPVRLYTGEQSRQRLQQMLNPGNRMRKEDRDALVGSVMDVMADPHSGLADFIAVAGAERIFPEHHFLSMYNRPSIDQAALSTILGVASK